LKDKEKLLKLGVDNSDLANNGWLSGFLEADGNFYCNFSMNTAGIANNIRYYMRISQKAVYIRKNDLTKSEESFIPLMQTIADFLDVSKVNLIHRTKTNYFEEAFEVRTVKRESCQKLINYLSKYPLYSSKYLDFLSWSEIHEINKSKLYKTLEGSNQLLNLKSKMNTSRAEFDWKHLDNFYKEIK